MNPEPLGLYWGLKPLVQRTAQGLSVLKFASIWKSTLFKKLIATEEAEERTYFTLALLAGFFTAVIAVFLYESTHYLTEFFRTNEVFTWRTLLLAGGSIFLSGYLTTRFFPDTSGSGISNVKISLAVYHGKISFKTTMAKLLVTIFSLPSGFSLGTEGPTVTIAAGIGSSLGGLFSMSKKRVKGLVAIGAAAGIAAAFQAPIAAVVFTLEEVVGHISPKAVGKIIIASVVASATAYWLSGRPAMFSDLHYVLHDKRELIIYLIIGLVCSVLGPLWVKSVIKLRSINLKIFKNHRLTPIMLTFLVIAAISHIDPRAIGAGTETTEAALLSLIIDWKVLLLLLVLKYFATTISAASGVSGGLILPSLLIGALIGGVIGSVAHNIVPEIAHTIGPYALVGMGAYFAAVTRAPFTSILIVFEITRNYGIIFPLMIANVVSYIISSYLHEGSVYENFSKQNGIHLPTREDHEVLESLNVEDAMNREVISLNATLNVREALQGIIKNSNVSGFPVLKNGLLIGMVSTNEIGQMYAKGETEKIIEDIAEKKIISIYPDQSLFVAFHKLNNYQISRLPVVSRLNERRIIGIITAENIVAKFGYHLAEEKDKTLKHKELFAQIEKENQSSAPSTEKDSDSSSAT